MNVNCGARRNGGPFLFLLAAESRPMADVKNVDAENAINGKDEGGRMKE
jgi:hypothetical protein